MFKFSSCSYTLLISLHDYVLRLFILHLTKTEVMRIIITVVILVMVKNKVTELLKLI